MFRFFVFVKLVDFLVILTVSYISFHVIDSSFNFVVFLGMTAILWFGSRLTRSVYKGTLTSACFCFLSLLCHWAYLLSCYASPHVSSFLFTISVSYFISSSLCPLSRHLWITMCVFGLIFWFVAFFLYVFSSFLETAWNCLFLTLGPLFSIPWQIDSLS